MEEISKKFKRLSFKNYFETSKNSIKALTLKEKNGKIDTLIFKKTYWRIFIV